MEPYPGPATKWETVANYRRVVYRWLIYRPK